MPTITPDIFSTVPQRDYLSLFEGNRPNCQRIVRFLGLRNEEVAKATGLPFGSIRYDEKMPVDLIERIREWGTLLNLVAEFFQGDSQKTSLWFAMPNPLLGDVAPRDMIRSGRDKKLFKFVVTALSENKPTVPASPEFPISVRHGPDIGEKVAKEVFWDYEVDLQEMKRLLQNKRPEKRLWVIGRILKYARWEDVRQLLTTKDIEEALPKVDLPEVKRRMLENALEVWRHGK
ncbi:MAG: hypothetical protein HY399_03470 [Elusimicrobia bacterium]|nr:hypothetical protein [Elusimicrobiota bacterium]